MWACFKEELEERISQFVPKTKKFTTFKKDAWKHPLNSSLLQKISKKTVCGQDTWKLVMPVAYL